MTTALTGESDATFKNSQSITKIVKFLRSKLRCDRAQSINLTGLIFVDNESCCLDG